MKIAAAGVVAQPLVAPVARPDQSGFYPLIGYFRETNAEATRIRERLLNALHLAEAGKDEPATLRAFDDARHMIRREIEQAKHRAAEIERLRTTDPASHARYARELVQVTNGWDDLDQLWPPPQAGETKPAGHAKSPLAEPVASAHASIAALDAVIFICACQSIPSELDDYLANYRVGTRLDFVATFKDQLPDEAWTRKVLAWLAPQSGVVSGLIDLESAVVIKADQRAWRQALSAGLVLATVGLGFGLAAIGVHMGAWLRLMEAKDWPTPDQWATLNGAYLLVLLGVLGHWVLDRVKQNRSGTDVTPLAEWLMWIHVNEVPIIVRIATVWLMVLLGVAFKTFDVRQPLQALPYFTAGYFMDSTFDALVGRFNTFVSEKSPEKKKADKAAA